MPLTFSRLKIMKSKCSGLFPRWKRSLYWSSSPSFKGKRPIKPSKILAVLSFFILCTAAVQAQTTKTITLSDGSVIRGEIISVQDGLYRIQTSNMGVVNIYDADIQSISKGNMPVGASSGYGSSANLSGMGLGQGQHLAMAQELLADPELMAEVEAIMADPELMQALSNPGLMQKVLNADPSQLINDPTLKSLMENPKFMSFMNKVRQKLQK